MCVHESKSHHEQDFENENFHIFCEKMVFLTIFNSNTPQHNIVVERKK